MDEDDLAPLRAQEPDGGSAAVLEQSVVAPACLPRRPTRPRTQQRLGSRAPNRRADAKKFALLWQRAGGPPLHDALLPHRDVRATRRQPRGLLGRRADPTSGLPCRPRRRALAPSVEADV